MKFNKKIILSMFLSVYIFIFIMIVLFTVKNSIPDSLVNAFFIWMGVEGGALAWIKNVDTKHIKKEGEDVTKTNE